MNRSIRDSKNDINRLNYLKSALRNRLRRNLKNGLIDIDFNELNTYKKAIDTTLEGQLVKTGYGDAEREMERISKEKN